MNRQRFTSILTVVVVGFWMVMAVVRPGAATILSPPVMMMIGYWFRVASKNGAT